MGLDARLLIKQVEERPALWDRQNGDYCNKKVISKLWTEIANTHCVHVTTVRAKWKALRDTFRQELKKNPHHSPWNFYLDMQFIKGQLRSIHQACKPDFEGEELDNVILVKKEPEPEPEDFNAFYQEENTTGKSEEMEGEEHPCSSMDLEEDKRFDDDDYHFLMSLLPEMRKLQPQQKLLLRIKMMQLFYQEAYPNDL